MTDFAQDDGREALLTLISLARQELADAMVNFTPATAEDIRQQCVGQLDNLVWAANNAGLENLYLVADAVLTHTDDSSQAFDAERVSEILNWLADAYLYVEVPAEPGLIELLLSPLPQATQASLAAILGGAADPAEAAVPPQRGGDDAAAEQTDDWAKEWIDEGAVETATADAEWPGDDDAGSAAGDGDIDTDSVLGMLAYELREVSPGLVELAHTIVDAAADGELAPAVETYREIVGRVLSVAQELELEGLAMVCRFVEENLALAAAQQPTERAAAIDVLQHWPRPVIEHLCHPEDDARCIALIDYLERDDWPEPLPYRDLRKLIEGLTASAEAGGRLESDQRELEASDEDVSLDMSADASAELIEAFFDESPGHAETLSGLVTAIADGGDIQDSVEAAQRIAHTLKGSGNLVGVRGIANLAHHIEDILEYVARNRITPPSALANTMQEAADTIEAMIEALQGMAPAPADAKRVLQDVLDWANRIDSGKMRSDDYRAGAERGGEAAAAEVREERRAQQAGEQAPAAAAAESVRVPLRLLDQIFRIVSETAITSGQIQERLNRLETGEKMIRSNDTSMQQLRYELENLVSIRALANRHRGAGLGDAEGDFDPLEMDEYDEFYGATHAYIESVADSREILRGFSGEVLELDALFVEQQRLNKELQQLVMTTRMVPVSNLASRLQRSLRQACRATGKRAGLSILGQDLMLDGDVLNKLADPLMHMLRNAVDHGIETAEIREAGGKAPVGQVVLRFHQEGNNVVVSCSDDGAGLDYARIRQTAIDRGLLRESEEADRQSLANLILQSGFSTRDRVTHVSGRGVGMDVVHNTIQSLSGSMGIAEAPGGGTLITLRLPITLLTSHCLLVGLGKDTQYAVPTIGLAQILSPGIGTIEAEDDRLTFRLEQEVYPAYTLNSLVGAPDPVADEGLAGSNVLLVQTADGISAVCVERVVTSYDLVVKNMGAYVKSVSGIAGVSMLGNGEVVAVLDLAAMLQAQTNRGPAVDPRAALPEAEIELPRIMIVDDSLSVRNSLAQLMQDSGYRAILARDGREAVTLLDSEKPDVVLTDLEMPRMNGLELVSYIRNSSNWKDLPTVMITSRNMSKHRQQAQQAGVDRFIPKPFSEDEVLEAIDAQLASLA